MHTSGTRRVHSNDLEDENKGKQPRAVGSKEEEQVTQLAPLRIRISWERRTRAATTDGNGGRSLRHQSLCPPIARHRGRTAQNGQHRLYWLGMRKSLLIKYHFGISSTTLKSFDRVSLPSTLATPPAMSTLQPSYLKTLDNCLLVLIRFTYLSSWAKEEDRVWVY